MFCVYALVDSPGPVQSVTGLAGERLRGIAVDGVVAIVGEVRRRPAASTRNLRKYASIVESIAARVPAILPVRFGTTFTDLAELRSVLRSRRAATRQRLRAVRRRAQMTIRIVGSDPDDEHSRGLTPLMSRTGVRPRNEATQGTRYLRQRLAVLRTASEVPELAPIQMAIRGSVKEERVERCGGVITVHHLIPRARAARYLAAVERAAGQSGIRLAISGPFPPYAFADNW